MQLEAQVERQREMAGIVTSIEAFCQRVGAGLAETTFEQKRTLVELLIDRVLIANGDVEIRYAIPTALHGETTCFCQLRKDYFDDVIQIFNLADCNRGAVLLIVALDRRFVGRAAINNNLLGHATMTANRLDQKLLGGWFVTLLGEQKVNGFTVLVNGTIEICPLALHFNIRLIHASTGPHRALAAVKCLLELWTVFHHPTIDRGMIDVNPTLLHEFLDMTRAERVGQIPPAPQENDLWGEMRTFETDRHCLAPSCITVAHGEELIPQMASHANLRRNRLLSAYLADIHQPPVTSEY